MGQEMQMSVTELKFCIDVGQYVSCQLGGCL